MSTQGRRRDHWTTSLDTIVPTSISSARAHHSRGAVDLELARRWALPLLIGALAGSLLASAFFVWISGYGDTHVADVVEHFVAWQETLDGDTVYPSDKALLPLFPDLSPFALPVED